MTKVIGRPIAAVNVAPPTFEYDVTGTVRLDRPDEVADAVCRILHRGFGGLGAGESFLRQSFVDVELAFWGKYPGLLRCDTPYHDLRHSLDTALLIARMADGWQCAEAAAPRLSADDAVTAVVLGVLHDVGFIRRHHEAHLVGAQLMRSHEARSVEFAARYFAESRFAIRQGWAALIEATNFSRALPDVLTAYAEADAPARQVVARMIGSADLLAQVSDRFYLERCRDFLYREFADAGVDRATTPNGETVVLYRDGLHLLEQTPAFYENLVRRRLDEDFQGIDRVLTAHFEGADPYRESLERNLAYVTRLIAENGLAEGLRRHPSPLLPT